jgi:hypothetical protein
MRIYISQLDNLVTESQNNLESFYEELGSLESFDKVYKEGPEKAKSKLLEIHQMCEKQILDFTIQSDVVVKFVPHTGSYIKENIESLKEIVTDFLNMINTPIEKNQTESFQFTQSMKFLGIISEMQQTLSTIIMLITTVSNATESTLEFLEN